MSDDQEKWEMALEMASMKMDFEKREKEFAIKSTGFYEQHTPDGFVNFGTKEERTARISKDPVPQWREEAPRNYKTTEKHYIIVADEALANESLPHPYREQQDENGENFTHKMGAFLVSDRFEVPKGWVKSPAKGTAITIFKDKNPELFQHFTEKGITNL